MQRAMLSARAEAGRARSWMRSATTGPDRGALGRVLAASSANLAAAVADPVRRPRWWCPCCDRVTTAFRWTGNHQRLSRHAVCPACGSRSRHRALALALDRLVPSPPRSVLHFAPEPPLAEVVARLGPGRVVTTDLARDDVDRPGEDIQDLGFGDGEFDLVLCNHVLEHVADDRAAMAELARVTAPGGRAVVSVPGDWSRSETVAFADTRHNGHHRDYGADVVDALGAAFAHVEVLVFADLGSDPRWPGRPGLRPDDRLFICHP